MTFRKHSMSQKFLPQIGKISVTLERVQIWPSPFSPIPTMEPHTEILSAKRILSTVASNPCKRWLDK